MKNPYLIPGMKSYLLDRWDYIAKYTCLFELKKHFPQASIKDCLEAWKLAYEN